MLFSDDVAKAILNTARAHECTMIVLGLTGKGVLKRLIEGNVPANILKASPIPVLMFPEMWEGLL
jgi:nucleotide-binding universal stress UspA family protein